MGLRKTAKELADKITLADMTPQPDRLIVSFPDFSRPANKKKGEEEVKTKGGIILPKAVAKNMKEGSAVFAKVLKCGTFTDEKTDIKVGDEVMLPPYYGTDVFYDGDLTPWSIIGVGDILVVVRRKK